jgi:hypothetical protein
MHMSPGRSRRADTANTLPNQLQHRPWLDHGGSSHWSQLWLTTGERQSTRISSRSVSRAARVAANEYARPRPAGRKFNARRYPTTNPFRQLNTMRIVHWIGIKRLTASCTLHSWEVRPRQESCLSRCRGLPWLCLVWWRVDSSEARQVRRRSHSLVTCSPIYGIPSSLRPGTTCSTNSRPTASLV